jgi:hypothetical protein
MAFTEFCCRSGGSNLNAGTLKGDSTEPGTTASYTYASGNWVQSTGVFTVASGDPASDGVAVGDFASVYADGSTETGFVGRITARDATTITVSLTAKAGTAPTDGTGTRTLKVGGAWQGPNGASSFPYTLATLASLKVATGEQPRINLKNDQTYSISATVNTTSIAGYGPHAISGYTTTYYDGGVATFDGGGNGFSMVSIGYRVFAAHLKVTNNGSGSFDGFSSDFRAVLFRCIATGIARIGFGGGTCIECESYSNNGNYGGFYSTTSIRCVSHSNYYGIEYANGPCVNCVCYNNTLDGIYLSATDRQKIVLNCDCYENGRDGIRDLFTSQYHTLIENCNLFKNAGWGIGTIGTASQSRYIANCCFGSGTQANTSGEIQSEFNTFNLGNHVIYTADETPWNDPDSGDFSVVGDLVKGAGRGLFGTLSGASNPTIGYPDIGAAQALASGGGGSTLHPLYATGRK